MSASARYSNFHCDACGLCCRNLPGGSMTAEYRTDGGSICKHLDQSTNRCKIYNSRPSFCRVDEGYDLFFRETLSKDEYYKKNYEACAKLKR